MAAYKRAGMAYSTNEPPRALAPILFYSTTKECASMRTVPCDSEPEQSCHCWQTTPIALPMFHNVTGISLKSCCHVPWWGNCGCCDPKRSENCHSISDPRMPCVHAILNSQHAARDVSKRLVQKNNERDYLILSGSLLISARATPCGKL